MIFSKWQAIINNHVFSACLLMMNGWPKIICACNWSKKNHLRGMSKCFSVSSFKCLSSVQERDLISGLTETSTQIDYHTFISYAFCLVVLFSFRLKNEKKNCGKQIVNCWRVFATHLTFSKWLILFRVMEIINQKRSDPHIDWIFIFNQGPEFKFKLKSISDVPSLFIIFIV